MTRKDQGEDHQEAVYRILRLDPKEDRQLARREALNRFHDAFRIARMKGLPGKDFLDAPSASRRSQKRSTYNLDVLDCEDPVAREYLAKFEQLFGIGQN